jgi:hypothetical protein
MKKQHAKTCSFLFLQLSAYFETIASHLFREEIPDVDINLAAHRTALDLQAAGVAGHVTIPEHQDISHLKIRPLDMGQNLQFEVNIT